MESLQQVEVGPGEPEQEFARRVQSPFVHVRGDAWRRARAHPEREQTTDELHRRDDSRGRAPDQPRSELDADLDAPLERLERHLLQGAAMLLQELGEREARFRDEVRDHLGERRDSRADLVLEQVEQTGTDAVDHLVEQVVEGVHRGKERQPNLVPPILERYAHALGPLGGSEHQPAGLFDHAVDGFGGGFEDGEGLLLRRHLVNGYIHRGGPLLVDFAQFEDQPGVVDQQRRGPLDAAHDAVEHELNGLALRPGRRSGAPEQGGEVAPECLRQILARASQRDVGLAHQLKVGDGPLRRLPQGIQR